LNHPGYLRHPRQFSADDSGSAFERLAERVGSLIPVDPVEWIESEIIMETTKAGAESGTITLEPYQVDPIRAQFEKGVKMVVISGPEQFGKSFSWKCPMVYAMRFISGLFYIVYEEREKARKINDEEFHPMVNAVEYLANQLRSGEGTYRKGGYSMRENIVDFMGAGADITSRRVKRATGDEIDTYPLTYDKTLAQVGNIQKRLRRAYAAGDGMLTLCSSFKGGEDDSAMHHFYQLTSRGLYTLRCLNCGELKIESTKVDGYRDPYTKEFHGGLKWLTEDGALIPESIRLECPYCKHSHHWEDSREMVEDGEYVHGDPDNYTERGFLFGSLSSYYDKDEKRWVALSWEEIARSRIKAGRTNNYEVIRTHWNSFVGLPVPKKKMKEDRGEAIVTHCHDWDPGCIKAVIGAADTQESPFGWFWIIRGLDEKWNSYLLAFGFAETREELDQVIRGTYEGLPVTLFIIDQGGTNAEDVKTLAKKNKNCWQYKGASRPQSMWALSTTKGQTRLLLCDAGKLQVMLIRLLYEQDDRDNNYWFLPDYERFLGMEESVEGKHEKMGYGPDVFNYTAHIASVRPKDNDTHGDKRQNWDCGSHERRDWFDCEKMVLVLMGRKQFRLKIQRAMRTKDKKAEKKEKRTRGTTKQKPTTFVNKAKRDGSWMQK